jgi:hypothetical protein
MSLCADSKMTDDDHGRELYQRPTFVHTVCKRSKTASIGAAVS